MLVACASLLLVYCPMHCPVPLILSCSTSCYSIVVTTVLCDILAHELGLGLGSELERVTEQCCVTVHRTADEWRGTMGWTISKWHRTVDHGTVDKWDRTGQVTGTVGKWHKPSAVQNRFSQQCLSLSRDWQSALKKTGNRILYGN